MFKTILVPTDGSSFSDRTISAAVDFARSTGGKIIGLSVVEPYPFIAISESAMVVNTDIYQEQMQKQAQMNVQKIADAAQTGNVPYETVVAQSFSPYEEIINVAKKFNCDIIFMASHGRKGLSKLFVGSETQKVLAHSTIPVLVFRQDH